MAVSIRLWKAMGSKSPAKQWIGAGKRDGNEGHEFGLPVEVEGDVRYRARGLAQARVPKSILKGIGCSEGWKAKVPFD